MPIPPIVKPGNTVKPIRLPDAAGGLDKSLRISAENNGTYQTVWTTAVSDGDHAVFDGGDATAKPATTVDFDYVVDSENGDDSNDGTEAAPFQTLAKLLTVIEDGQTIGLAAGSLWREELDLQEFENVTLMQAGSGTKPRISGGVVQDASTAIQPDDVTYPNLWRITLASVGTEYLTHIRLLEDRISLTRAQVTGTGHTDECSTRYATEAECFQHVDDTEGSFYYKLDGTTQYMYFNVGEDPTANGKEYEVTYRELCVHQGPGLTLESLTLEAARHRNGSPRINAWKDISLKDVEMLSYGCIHVSLIGGNYFADCLSDPYGDEIKSGYHLNSAGDGDGVAYVRCKSYNAETAFYNHDNKHPFACIVDCETANTPNVNNYALNSIAENGNLYIIGHKHCVPGNVKGLPYYGAFGYLGGNGPHNTYIENLEGYFGETITIQTQPGTSRIYNSRFYVVPGTSKPNFLRVNGVLGVDIEFDYCSFFIDYANAALTNPSNNLMISLSGTNSGSITFKNCNFFVRADNLHTGTSGVPYYLSSGSGVTIDFSENNHFYYPYFDTGLFDYVDSDMYENDPADGDWTLTDTSPSTLNDIGWRADRPSRYRLAAANLVNSITG